MPNDLCCLLSGTSLCKGCSTTWCPYHYDDAEKSHPRLGLTERRACPSGNRVILAQQWEKGQSRFEYEYHIVL